MTDTFARLYNASAFDPNDRQDQIGELARKTLLTAALNKNVTGGIQGGDDMPFLIGGLMVGIVQIIKATAGGMTSDEIDAAIRVSIMQIAPWAVDMARSVEGKGPLAHD